MINSRFMRRTSILAGTVAAMLIVASSALAVPTLVAPANGATELSSHPAFSWTLDEGQDIIAVRVSNQPTLKDDGVLAYPAGKNPQFVSYYPDAATESMTSFTPKATNGLPAGTYYWQLQVYDSDQAFISPLQSFTIPPKTQLRTLTATARARVQRLSIRLGHTVNSDRVKYRLDIMQGRKRIGRPITGTWYNGQTVGLAKTEAFSFRPINFTLKRGQRYTIKARITANGKTQTRSRSLTVSR